MVVHNIVSHIALSVASHIRSDNIELSFKITNLLQPLFRLPASTMEKEDGGRLIRVYDPHNSQNFSTDIL